ncbi:MAG: HNH endonuclease [Acinetobacter calcoaceticus]
MIKLNKLNKPAVLIKNENKWKNRLLQNIADGKKSTDYLLTRYSDPEIKRKIIEETSGKCAYCESKLLHIQHGDIEHIFPKSIDQSKRYEWTNLTLACERCNQNKSDNDPNLKYILNPYVDNPEDSLFFLGTMAVSIDDKGFSTEAILGLNRTNLLEQRKDRLEKITLIFKNITNTNLPLPVRQTIYNDLKNKEASNSNEFTSMVKCSIEQLKPRLPNDIID